MSNQVTVKPLSKDSVSDFYKINCQENGLGWCHCVAWWTKTWEEFANRSQEDNEKQRTELFSHGQYDGYILYIDEKPVGWCQTGPRDRLEKLVPQYELIRNDSTWAITCISIIPDFRGMGLTNRFVKEVLDNLKERGVTQVQAFPVRGTQDPWTGPESVYKRAGFAMIKDHPQRPIYEKLLA
jgi:GNAT superfamily N-acetyltransferase